jgi:phage repressor protein C with HTH and peptisase S24 domain
MEPEFRQGDIALVNPHLPVVADAAYIFIADQPGSTRATIKWLRRMTGDKWFVTQHNPPPGQHKDFMLSRKEWQRAEKVIGKYAHR